MADKGLAMRFTTGLAGPFCPESGFDKRSIIGFLGPEEPWSLTLARFGEELDLCNFGLSTEDCLFTGDCCCLCAPDCGVTYAFPVVGGFQCVVCVLWSL